MSVQTQIDRIKGAVQAAHEKVAERGGTTSAPFLVDNLAEVIDTIPEAKDPVLQTRTISPITSSRTYYPDSGYDGFSSVTVNGMPTSTPPKPTITVGSTGIITARAEITKSGFLTSGSFNTATKSLEKQEGGTITPTTTDTVLAKGKYIVGDVTIKGDANLVPENIAKDVSIFGVAGTHEGVDVVNEEVTEYTDLLDELEVTVMTLFPEKRPFADCTWAEISEICKAGKAKDYWKIGDTKPMREGSTVNLFRIIGFDHDDVADVNAYGREKAGITLEMVDPPTNMKQFFMAGNDQYWTWNPAATSETNDTTNYYRKTYLPDFFNNTMTEELRSVIVDVRKDFLNNSGTMVYGTDTLFLLSVNEMLGTYTSGVGSEGEQYAYFAAGNSPIVPVANEYRWTRSKGGTPSNSMGHSIYCIKPDGKAQVYGPTNLYAYGIPCFCI